MLARYVASARHEVEIRDVEYLRRAGERLLASIYRPKGGATFPALVDIHGGAWSGGSRLGSAVFHERLAATGLVVAAFDFRVAPAHPYPAQVADTNYATRWLKARASDFGGDVSHLGGIGSSSGGHTLMLSAMRPQDARYRGAPVKGGAGDASLAYTVLRWPVLDPLVRYRYVAGSERDGLKAATEGYFLTEEAMGEGNPTMALERGEALRLPPALIVQGTADGNVPMTIPNAFVRAYRARGGRVDIELFEGMPHAFMGQPGPETDRAFEVITAFIERQLAG